MNGHYTKPPLSKLRSLLLLLSLKTFVGFVEEYVHRKEGAKRYYIFTSVAPRQCFKTSTLVYRIDRQDATAVWHDFELAFRLRPRVKFDLET